jgi:hypothetical protein
VWLKDKSDVRTIELLRRGWPIRLDLGESVTFDSLTTPN